ncbi:hypothetical protein PPUN15366_42370 [Pseudomonas putida]|nr:hypothetical protein PPUN15366_42370 [Pseudomonas putida]
MFVSAGQALSRVNPLPQVHHKAQDLWGPVGAGSPAKGPDLLTCNPLYGKSISWKKQRFIPSCAKSGISRDDGAGNLAYPQSSQHLAEHKKEITK